MDKSRCSGREQALLTRPTHLACTPHRRVRQPHHKALGKPQNLATMVLANLHCASRMSCLPISRPPKNFSTCGASRTAKGALKPLQHTASAFSGTLPFLTSWTCTNILQRRPNSFFRKYLLHLLPLSSLQPPRCFLRPHHHAHPSPQPHPHHPHNQHHSHHSI